MTDLQKNYIVAGFSSVDITPPPGLPLAGFSTISDSSRGLRTRLKAKVLYLKSGNNKPVTIVVCDLLSGSILLHHKISEQIKNKTDIERAGLLLAGTHTHSAAGNYFGSDFYNSYASNKSGFEQNFLNFLLKRISNSIIDAYNKQAPAKIATGSTKIYNVTINRSLNAYLNNDNIKNNSKFQKSEAVNPSIHVIRIDCMDNDGKYKPIGAFSTFSIHPNTKPQYLDKLYNGDVFAYIQREVEQGIYNHYKTSWYPVHAAANYTHGDNNPDKIDDFINNYIHIKKIGTIIGQKALELIKSLDNDLKGDVFIKYNAKEIDLLKHYKDNNDHICSRAAIGCALLAGAENKNTLLYYIPPFAPGNPRKYFTGTCQGHKRIAFGPLQYLYLKKECFPRLLFTQIIQIHDTLIIPLPFEICYEAGKRIASHAQNLCNNNKSINKFVPVSCSNGYFGYVTTPEEYQIQHYEGGHTIYGFNTLAYINNQLTDIINNFNNSNYNMLINKWDFHLKSKNYYPLHMDYNGGRYEDSKPEYNKKEAEKESYWSFKWFDVPPDKINFHNPLVKIEYKNKSWQSLMYNNFCVDDDGYDIAIIFLNKLDKNNMGLYEARWYNPEKYLLENENYNKRFAILPRNGQEIFYSSIF